MLDKTDAAPKTLADLFEANTDRATLAAGSLRVFDDANALWLIAQGAVDLYAVRRRNGVQTGPREHLCELLDGSLIWGINQSDTEDGIHLVAMPGVDTLVIRIDPKTLGAMTADPQKQSALVYGLEAWIEGLAKGVAKHLKPRKPREAGLEVGEERSIENTARVSAVRGVVWMQVAQGVARFVDVTEITSVDGTAMVPITPTTWLEGLKDCHLIGHATDSVLVAPDLPGRMDVFHGWVFHALAYNLRNATAREVGRLKRRETEVSVATERTFSALKALLTNEEPRGQVVATDDALFDCCRLVGDAMGARMVMPPWAKRRRASEQPVSIHDIANASMVRVRQVVLRGTWWREDNGPLVAQMEEDGRPVALLPKGGTRYVLHDPLSKREVEVTGKIAQKITGLGYVLYAGLPARPVGMVDLLRFGLRTSRADLLVLLFAGMAGGFFTITIPFAAGYLFDDVIPEHRSAHLIQVGLAMAAVALGVATFRLAADIAQLRIEGRVAATLQAAVMDRLLRLPNQFFSAYSTGDLALRGMAIETIRTHLSGAVLGSLVAGLFSLFNLGFLFLYSVAAGLAALGVLTVLAITVTLLGQRLMRASMRAAEMTGRVSSLILALLSGVTKLRLSGAEERVFNLWGVQFREMRESQVRAFHLNNTFVTCWAGLETLGLALLFGAVVHWTGPSLSTGAFLAVITAFTTLTLAAGGAARAVMILFFIAPVYERAKPILRTPPEVDLSKADPGPLSGGFEVSNVRFRYSPDMPLVLDGVSVSAKPGEFVAIVGPSGSGKSTLIRLLLGFEVPETGGVFFDGQDLRGFDLQRVRSQIGVVLQNGRLMPGTILENIQGAADASPKDCWDAAVKAGIAAEIDAMPMGMQTVLTEGTSTLSGGQIQRVLVARAIVAKPRLLLLDEATSALDNKVQAVVTESLNRLNVTRVVIAHRLSTIIDAHRIYVIDRGRVVETGTHKELIDRDGVFAELVRRQHL